MLNAYVSDVYTDINNSETIIVMLVHNKETLLNTLYTGNLSFCFSILDSLKDIENKNEINEELLNCIKGNHNLLTRVVPRIRVEDTLISFYTLMWDASRRNCLIQFNDNKKSFLVHDVVFKEDELSICINDNDSELFLLKYDKNSGIVNREDFHLLIPAIKYLEFSNYRLDVLEEIEIDHSIYLKVKFPKLLSIYRNTNNFAINNKLIVDYYYKSKILSACGEVLSLLINHLGSTTGYSRHCLNSITKSSIFNLNKGLKIVDINRKLSFSDEELKAVANKLVGFDEPITSKTKEIYRILSEELKNISSPKGENSSVFLILELAKLHDKIRKQSFEKNMYLFNLRIDFLVNKSEYKNITGMIERNGIKYILEDN